MWFFSYNGTTIACCGVPGDKGIPRSEAIVRERRSVTPDTALRLARHFGTTTQFWMNLQASYDLKIAAREAGARINKEVEPRAA